MKKALIIANMLFASATVFGMKSYRDVSQESRENSMHLLSANDDYELAKKLQEQEAIYDSMRKSQQAEEQKNIDAFLRNGKIVNNKLNARFAGYICEALTLEDLLKNPHLTNPGSYTWLSLEIVTNQKKYTLVEIDHGALLNGLGNQCVILALNVDEDTRNKIQQLKVPTGNSYIVPFAVENADGLDGSFITLGEYIAPIGGLPSNEENIFETLANILDCRIDIFEYLTGKDPSTNSSNESIYYNDELYSIISYGVRFEKVKRLALHSTITYDSKGKMSTRGHYTELRVFNEDGSQVK